MDKKLAFKVFFKNPISVILAGVRAEEQNYFKKQTKQLHKLEQLPTIDILDLFPNLEEDLKCYSYLNGTSLVTDLILLKSLARKFLNCAYLEIGSWRGESLVNISDVTNDITSISLSLEELRTIGVSENFIKVHGVFSEHISTIKKVECNSHTFDFSSLQKKFDLVFIDGDHSYKGVYNDTTKVLPILKDKNSIIVWHDYGFNTEDTRYTTLKAILDAIPKEKHKNLYHVSNTLCAVYIEDANFKTSLINFPSIPNKKFSLKLKAFKLND